MKNYRLKNLIICLPIFSLLVAAASVAYQYSYREKIKEELVTKKAKLMKMDSGAGSALDALDKSDHTGKEDPKEVVVAPIAHPRDVGAIPCDCPMLESGCRGNPLWLPEEVHD